MSEKKVPLGATEREERPPTYEAAAIQHGDLPSRNGPSQAAGGKPLPRGPFPLDIPVLNSLRGKRIILASGSPRRKQILSTVSTNLFFHTTCSSPFERLVL